MIRRLAAPSSEPVPVRRLRCRSTQGRYCSSIWLIAPSAPCPPNARPGLPTGLAHPITRCAPVLAVGGGASSLTQTCVTAGLWPQAVQTPPPPSRSTFGFMVSEFVHDDDGYLLSLATNPHGFVVNSTNPMTASYRSSIELTATPLPAHPRGARPGPTTMARCVRPIAASLSSGSGLGSVPHRSPAACAIRNLSLVVERVKLLVGSWRTPRLADPVRSSTSGRGSCRSSPGGFCCIGEGQDDDLTDKAGIAA